MSILGDAALRDSRADEPVFYEPLLDVWVVTRYGDVNAVVRDTETYSSESAITTSTRPLPEPVHAVLAQGHWPMLMVTETDAPDHKRLRNVLRDGFTPRRLAELAPKVQTMATEIIDGFAMTGHANIIEAYARPLPVSVIGGLLGVDPAMYPQMRVWSADLMVVLQGGADVDALVESARGVVSMQQYFGHELASRRASPRDDLLSAMARDARAGGVSDEEVGQLPVGLLAAGHLTVTRSMGSAILRLLSEAGLAERVAGDENAMGAFVEEILRVEAPTQGMFRTVRRETELGGVTLTAGSRVMVHYGSANLDERAFDHPEEIDLGRPDHRRHMSFGKGIHHCLGAPLVRIELPIALSVLLQRLPGLSLTDEPPVPDQVIISRGYDSVMVQWEPPDRR
jgi:cytochrome P450